MKTLVQNTIYQVTIMNLDNLLENTDVGTKNRDHVIYDKSIIGNRFVLTAIICNAEPRLSLCPNEHLNFVNILCGHLTIILRRSPEPETVFLQQYENQ